MFNQFGLMNENTILSTGFLGPIPQDVFENCASTSLKGDKCASGDALQNCLLQRVQLPFGK